MVLLLTNSQHDTTPESVMDWLSYYKQDFKRLHAENYSNWDLKNIKKVSTVWFWRWGFVKGLPQATVVDNEKNIITLNDNIRDENKMLSQYFMYLLKSKNWLSHPSSIDVNKLIVLDEAKAVGFNIPEYKIINSKKQLQNFKEEHGRVITKSLGNTFPLSSRECFTMFYTKEVTNIEAVSSTFPSSFIQKFIPKTLEIRTFYFNKEIFSMAIMTPNSEVDHRKYSKDLRKVPYQLTKEVEDKIHLLMETLNLETGSLDFMLGQDNLIYFLEVNPIGQFSMVSEPCNYFLEKKIALHLKTLHEKKH
ncbi:ATP-grasp domain-containing protein [Algibacter lectus]|uniref:ATP-GRASP peptide maturase of grasp-with-spasm system n=1 Tax=Algibacter lectus TaxID=221126 RepID=A0A4R8MI77_9FLAO|nr:hypothetical protein [Algibacter lectus]MWW24871.1 hypothetical protein [Algibacter lectus]TDY64718.1 ATP-GRASP peptide maturase of grasp-with-spasm system [Algibacter lectus]